MFNPAMVTDLHEFHDGTDNWLKQLFDGEHMKTYSVTTVKKMDHLLGLDLITVSIISLYLMEIKL